MSANIWCNVYRYLPPNGRAMVQTICSMPAINRLSINSVALLRAIGGFEQIIKALNVHYLFTQGFCFKNKCQQMLRKRTGLQSFNCTMESMASSRWSRKTGLIVEVSENWSHCRRIYLKTALIVEGYI